MIHRRHRCLTNILVAVALSFAAHAKAVILYRTGDPAANTTEPTGALAGSGWQYEGKFGNFLGTAIAAHFFITAHHIGGAPEFIYRGVTYPVVRSIVDTASDLAIHEVSGTLPTYAPLYSRSDEVGKQFVVIGRGTQRGTQRVVTNLLRGWTWGSSDMVQRWGQNQVASITGSGRTLYALFDQAGLPQEAHLSGGDSGGGLFINDAGTWKLAAINFDVDRFSSGPDAGGPFNAVMFDMRGSYRANGTLVTGNSPVPSGFYATRISPRIAWISSVIGVPPPPPPPISSQFPNDFNLDFMPDLIWQNNVTGKRVVWFMNGTTKGRDVYLPTVDTQWQIAATGDFNGDGQIDLLWQSNLTGQRTVWLMNETTWVGQRFLPTVLTQWKIAGTDDFNGDGQLDIVWQNTQTGQRTIWLMNGTTKVGEQFLPTIALSWQIAGTGEFSGDGHPDLIWQNTETGQREIWLMNGTTWVAERFLPTIATDWEIRNH